MKKIIRTESSQYGVEMGKQDVPESFLDLQILIRIEKLIGEKLPGSQFQAAKICCGIFKRKSIGKRAKELNSWAVFLKTGERKNYILITPSIKIAGSEMKILTQKDLASSLQDAELYAKAHLAKRNKKVYERQSG